MQATHKPLAAQRGVPVRPAQSLSRAHFAHRLPKQSGLCAGQSLSALQVPDASTAPLEGASRTGASAGLPTAGASGTVTGASAGVATIGASGTVTGASAGVATAGASGTMTGASAGVATRTASGWKASSPGPLTAASGSADQGASPAGRPSLPPSPAGTQRRSAVHAYPFWHGCLSVGTQTLQSRTSPHARANVTGRTNTRTFGHMNCEFVIVGILGCGLRKLREKSTQGKVSSPWLAGILTQIGPYRRVVLGWQHPLRSLSHAPHDVHAQDHAHSPSASQESQATRKDGQDPNQLSVPCGQEFGDTSGP